ncbi:MAG: DUF2073 domain-containing protein [Candidatus Aenigmarchaeota archaeon]|nr:DUF2073 domain-containing protein [Candidatus Aenigmarchaeota archaeon]
MKKFKLKKLKMDFLSSSLLDGKSSKSKINFILNKVRDGSILVMNGVLSSEEEMELIKETMRRVDDGFPGIEICSLKKQTKGWKQFFEVLSERRVKLQDFILQSLTGKSAKKSLKTGLTLIGPAKIIKEIKKNPDSFSVWAEV